MKKQFSIPSSSVCGLINYEALKELIRELLREMIQLFLEELQELIKQEVETEVERRINKKLADLRKELYYEQETLVYYYSDPDD